MRSPSAGRPGGPPSGWDGIRYQPRLSTDAGSFAYAVFDDVGAKIWPSTALETAAELVAAARTATQHLLTLGRRRIAAVGAALSVQSLGPGMRRMRGYVEAITAAGLSVTADLTLPTPGWTRAAGYTAAQQALDTGTDIDALFCFNDSLALGAIKGLTDRGVRIPEDIAVVGWDDIEECAYATPTLTSIAPDKTGIAHQAMDRLLDRISGQPVDPTEILADFSLIERESSTGRSTPRPCADAIRQVPISDPAGHSPRQIRCLAVHYDSTSQRHR